MSKITLSSLNKLKKQGSKIASLTAYDATFAALQSQAGVEIILVGDSLGMVLQGHESTLPVTIQDMVYHVRCVKNGIANPMLMADMPFMGCSSIKKALRYATEMMQAGAEIIKLEGGAWLAPTVEALAKNGVPTCIHLGLTPQSVHRFGGYKIQGRGKLQAQTLLEDAVELEQAGAALLLAECIPYEVTRKLSSTANIPVIGIGAGPYCDGQILVMHDMLGATPGKPARFVQNFLSDGSSIQQAFQRYVKAVKEGCFPSLEHSFE